MDLYLEALGDLSDANPAFANAISLIKAGIQKQATKPSEAPKPSVAKEETKTEAQNADDMTEEQAKQKVKTLERVIKEIKKQLSSYK